MNIAFSFREFTVEYYFCVNDGLDVITISDYKADKVNVKCYHNFYMLIRYFSI